MSEEIQHYDIDGNPCSLDELCRKDPAWAASRLRHERIEAIEMQSKLEELQSRLDKIRDLLAHIVVRCHETDETLSIVEAPDVRRLDEAFKITDGRAVAVEARIEALETEAGEAGDLLGAAICQIALYGEPNGSTYAVLSPQERDKLRQQYGEGDGWRKAAAKQACLEWMAAAEAQGGLMDRREFDRRAKALGTESRALPAARDVLVNGSGLRPAAAKHSVDVAYLQRLVRRIEATEVCPTCGQARV